MYEHFYKLSAEPFRLSPDHRFCYNHAKYAKAKAYMAYAFMRAEGFVLITGEPGTGKTTLVGDLIESLADENVVVGNLVSTQLAADDLLRMVAFAFGVDAETSQKSVLLQQLTACFLKLYRSGGRALLIVDEAQDLTAQALEELRLLTNLQEDGQPLLQIFLLGQASLQELVHTPDLDQVHQRIVAASQMEALGEDETRAYVEHRLHVVGWQDDPAISTSVYPIIHLFSQGIPRRINLICSRLFLHSSVEGRHQITVEDARTVVQELHEEQLSTRNLLHSELFHAADVFEPTFSLEVEIVAEQGAEDAPASEPEVDNPDDRSTPSGEDKTSAPAPAVDAAPLAGVEPVAAEAEQLAPEILDALIGELPEQMDPSDATGSVADEPEERSETQESTESEKQVEAVIPDNAPAVEKKSSNPVKWIGVGLIIVLIVIVVGGLIALQMGAFCGPGGGDFCSLESAISSVLEWSRQAVDKIKLMLR